METWDPGYRVSRCRERVTQPLSCSARRVPAPGVSPPCSRAGNTPHARAQWKMQSTARAGRTNRHSLIAYFLLAYGITWFFSILGTPRLVPYQIPPAVVALSSILLHYGPALASIIMARIEGGDVAVLRLLGSLSAWQVSAQWYVFILIFPVVIRLSAVGVDFLLGGEFPVFASSEFAPAGVNAVLLFIGILFQAGIAEEIGWRGYALPRLQTRFDPLRSSLILGVVWGLWHFHPINFSVLAPVGLWYILTIIPFTIVFTWVYNNTKGSLLIAVLFHTASNFSDWLIPIVPFLDPASTLRPFILNSMFMWIAALLTISHPDRAVQGTLGNEGTSR